MTHQKEPPKIIPPHGGYRDLKSYQMAEIIHDATAVFCDRFIDRRSRTHDQMVQAARSGKQNIAEGSTASGTSKKTELKLVGVARASLEELLLDYQDYLRQHGLPLWGKDHPQARDVQGLCYKANKLYLTPDQVRGRLYKPDTEFPAFCRDCGKYYDLPDSSGELSAGSAVARTRAGIPKRRRFQRETVPDADPCRTGMG